MVPIDEITKSLPPLRDDEPSSLRRDIADEILDHLQCSFRRELLLRGGDDASAKVRVLEHFGNPQQIARKLWFQAMWSKIMTQRLIVGSSIVSMLVSVTLVATVAWMLQAMQMQMTQQQQLNAAIIEQVTKLVPQSIAASPARELQWNQLTLQFALGSKGGPPAKGVSVMVDRIPEIGEISSGASVQKIVDETGLVDCGHVSAGRFRVNACMPWGEHMQQVVLTVHPGQDVAEEIVVPEREPENAEVVFRLEGIPESLERKKTMLAISLDRFGTRTILNHQWDVGRRAFNAEKTSVILVVPGDGIWINSKKIAPESFQLRSGFNIPENVSPDTVGIQDIVRSSDWSRIDHDQTIRLAAGTYDVSFTLLTVPPDGIPGDPQWSKGMINQLQIDPTLAKKQTDQTRAIEAGILNSWTIHVPEDFGEALRDYKYVFQGNGGGGFF